MNENEAYIINEKNPSPSVYSLRENVSTFIATFDRT